MSRMRLYNPTHFGGSVWIDKGARVLFEEEPLDNELESTTLSNIDSSSPIPVD
jgi:hypothetical protein